MSRRFWSSPWPLLLALVVGLTLRLYVALTHPIDYNGFWHIFIARNLSREYYGLAHPPLFLVILRAVDAVSHSRLAYQSISIFAGLGAVALVHRILRKVRTNPQVAFLGALTMATAQPAVFLSREVQSYMLAVFFVLWSFVFYLDIVRPEPSGWRPRVAFSALACLALLTEYFAGLYLVACVIAPLLVALARPAYGRALFRRLLRRALPDALTLLPPLIVAIALYELIAKPWVRRLNHLPEFYFVPGHESPAAFVTRGLWNIFNLFSPVTLWSPRRAAALVIVFVVLAFLAAVTRRRDADDVGTVPAALLTILLGIGVALGLRGLYPFGGAMRQQFLYFVFAVLAGFVAFDRVLEALGSAARRGLAVACFLAIGASVGARLSDLRSPGRDPFTAQTRNFRRAFGEAGTVQTDQFNLIGFFIGHHDWKWRFDGVDAGVPPRQRYTLEKDGRRITLLAHRGRWNFDVEDPKTYEAVRAAAEAAGAPCTVVFDVHQNLYKPVERKLPHLDPMVEASARTVASSEGLEIQRMTLRGDDVFMEVCRGGSPPP